MAGGQGRQSIPDDRRRRGVSRKYGTVAYLVIQDDSIRYEEYREDWTPQKLSNIFSATKSIVGLLVGIAYDEGFIESLDDKVSKYLPEFEEGDKITIRNLLTMSSGLDWDEAYTALISKTTQAYYGDRIRDLIMDLKVVEEPGKSIPIKAVILNYFHLCSKQL